MLSHYDTCFLRGSQQTTSKTQLHTDMNPGTCNLLSPEMQLSKKLLVIHFPRGGNEVHVLLDGGESQIGIPRVLKGIREGSSEPEWISNPRSDTFHLLLHSGKQELGKNYQADSDLTRLTDRGLRSNAAVPHITGLLAAVSVEQMFDAQVQTHCTSWTRAKCYYTLVNTGHKCIQTTCTVF